MRLWGKEQNFLIKESKIAKLINRYSEKIGTILRSFGPPNKWNSRDLTLSRLQPLLYMKRLYQGKKLLKVKMNRSEFGQKKHFYRGITLWSREFKVRWLQNWIGLNSIISSAGVTTKNMRKMSKNGLILVLIGTVGWRIKVKCSRKKIKTHGKKNSKEGSLIITRNSRKLMKTLLSLILKGLGVWKNADAIPKVGKTTLNLGCLNLCMLKRRQEPRSQEPPQTGIKLKIERRTLWCRARRIWVQWRIINKH